MDSIRRAIKTCDQAIEIIEARLDYLKKLDDAIQRYWKEEVEPVAVRFRELANSLEQLAP